MAELNYKHLHYLWMIAKAGGVMRAAERLHVTPQSISGQVKRLDESLGGGLLRRVGRRLEFTDAGRVALAYAEEIFPRGEELQDVLRRRSGGAQEPLRVGVADVVPKCVAFHLIEPLVRPPFSMRVVCRESRVQDLLAECAVEHLDVVIADAPMPTNPTARTRSHPVGTCGIAFLAAPTIAKECGRRFPRSLDGVPMLLPGDDAAVRARLTQWFATQRIRPRIVGEFDDPAMTYIFGEAGAGVFVAPAVLGEQLRQRHGVEVIGRTDDVSETFYVISIDRAVTGPAVLAMLRTGRQALFAESGPDAALRRRAGRRTRTTAKSSDRS